MKITLFGQARTIEGQLDDYLSTVSEGGLLFEQIMSRYATHGADETFESRRHQLRETEQRGNGLARTIARSLYTDMLIPDSRGDVLSLLQDTGYLLDLVDNIAGAVEVERPDVSDISERHRASFAELAGAAARSLETAVLAARAFFKDLSAVDEHVHKILFYESQCDELALSLKKEIFASDLPLARKIQIRDFIDMVDDLADEAEDVGNWIAIFTIKRSL